MDFSKWTITLLLLAVLNSSHNLEYDGGDNLQYVIELIDLELLDIFDNIAKARRASVAENRFENKTKEEESLGHYLHQNAEELKPYYDLGVPTELERNYTIYRQPGDGLLGPKDYSEIVGFHNDNERIKQSVAIPCVELVHGCPLTVAEYKSILAESRDEEELQLTWQRWQTPLRKHEKTYTEILSLVNKAGSLNDLASATTYWETLLEYEDAYAKADTFWEEIKPLYMKLHKFVHARLALRYNLTTEENTIPAYLLGSNFGEDWSNLADIVLPHPQVHADATTVLKYNDVRHIYQLTEAMTKEMGLGSFGQKFWLQSVFNETRCDNDVFTYCSSGYTAICDSNRTTWTKYLDAHETALKITLNNLDYYTYPSRNLREPIVDYVIEGMSAVLAVEHLPHHDILESNVFRSELSTNNTDRMTALLLVALRVLPRIPYYYLADKWRLEELMRPSRNVTHLWWKMRHEIQAVTGINNEETDYLGDARITQNKPYLGKFLGTIFAFQLLQEYRQKMADPTDNIVPYFTNETNLLDLLKSRSTGDWETLFTINFGLYDWSTHALREYFRPLEEYLEKAPLEQAEVVIKTTTTTTTTAKPKRKMLEQAKSIQADTPIEIPNNSNKAKEIDEKSDKSVPKASNTGVYVVIGAIFLLSVIGGAFYVYKKKFRKPRSNNRRFEA